MNILIIEDDNYLIEELSYNLEYEGHVTTLSTDGKLLLSDIEIIHKFDIVTLDLMFRFPDTFERSILLAGIVLIEKIRKVSNIPIIVISAHPYSAVKANISNYNYIYYFTKPFDSYAIKNFLGLLNELETTLPNT